MVNSGLNNNNTIIENVEYLDMLDPKNSWYFDAERFDVNFPLACSYRGDEPDMGTLFLSGWTRYWTYVFSYYSSQSDMTAFLISRPHISPIDSDLKVPGNDLFFSTRWDLEDNFFKPEFLFYLKDFCSKNETNHRFLFAARLEDFSRARHNFFYTTAVDNANFSYDPFNARSQLIITKDWGLVHRYYNWVFRNHQYENSRFTYYLEDRNLKFISAKEDFKNVALMADSSFGYLPKDFRNNPKEYEEFADDQLLGPYKLFDFRILSEIRRRSSFFSIK